MKRSVNDPKQPLIFKILINDSRSGINQMKTRSEIRHYKPFQLKQITSLKVLGYFILILGPVMFFYKQPENTPVSFFIELLLILFGVIILKDCWISQEYWRNESDTKSETTLE